MAETTDDNTGSGTSNDGTSGFSKFLKNQINGWVAAAIVLPTAVTWKGMPLYESQKGILETFTTLSCVLAMAFLYGSRELIPSAKSRVGRIAWPVVILCFIGATGFCGYEYVQKLIESAHYQPTGQTLSEALKSTELNDIHDGWWLIACYILTMLLAECAFFLLAFKEWKPSRSGK